MIYNSTDRKTLDLNSHLWYSRDRIGGRVSVGVELFKDPLAQAKQGQVQREQIHELRVAPEAKLERENRIIELLLMGESFNSVAKAMGMHWVRLRQIVRDPVFQERLKTVSAETHARVIERFKNVREHIDNRLNEMADLALDELEQLVESASSEKTKLSAIDSVLDRHPYTSRHGVVAAQGNAPAPAQLAVFLRMAVSTARELDSGNGNGSAIKSLPAPAAVEIEASVSERTS